MKKIDFKKEKIPFTQIANEVLQDSNLTAKAKGLYAYLYSKPDGWDFSIHRIFKDFKDGKRAIANALKELEDNGYLVRTRQENHRMNYELFIAKTATNNHLQNRNNAKPQQCKTATVSNKEIKVIKNINNKEYIYTSFQEFWSVYPKKVGKGLAESSWNKICSNLPKETVHKIIEHVRERAIKDEQWIKDNGQFIPNPATFLNQKRWYDEYKSIKKTNDDILYL